MSGPRPAARDATTCLTAALADVERGGRERDVGITVISKENASAASVEGRLRTVR
jgi:hypothetical protein